MTHPVSMIPSMICNVHASFLSHDITFPLCSYLLCQTTHISPICLAPLPLLCSCTFPILVRSYCSPFPRIIAVLLTLLRMSHSPCYCHSVTVTSVTVYVPPVTW